MSAEDPNTCGHHICVLAGAALVVCGEPVGHDGPHRSHQGSRVWDSRDSDLVICDDPYQELSPEATARHADLALQWYDKINREKRDVVVLEERPARGRRVVRGPTQEPPRIDPYEVSGLHAPPVEWSPAYRALTTLAGTICMSLLGLVFVYCLLTPDPCFYGPGC